MFTSSIDRGAVLCSVLTFLLIGVKRYTVLCYPLKSRGVWTLKRVGVLLLLIWVIAVGVSVPYSFMTKFEPCESRNSTRMCCNFNITP